MKRKGLAIIFFSVTVLAATPRAMEHFKSYISAARSEAQAHMLNYLLNYGVAEEEVPAKTATPAARQETVACNEAVEQSAAPENVGASNRTSIAKNGKTAPSQRNVAPASVAKAFSWSFEHVDVRDLNPQQFEYAIGKGADLLAPYVAKAGKLDAAKSLIRDSKNVNDKKAARVLERELYALFNSRTRTMQRRVPLMRVRMDGDVPAPVAVEPPSPPPSCDVANQQLTAGEY
jgi:hypothetical protein